MKAGFFQRVRRAFVEGRAAFSIGRRGLVQNRLRAFLSILGITIGVATLTAIMSITQGLSDSFSQQIAQLGANTLYITSQPWVIHGDWWRYRNRPNIKASDVLALQRNAPLLTAVAPMAFTQGEVSYLGISKPDVEIRGTNESYIDIANLKVDSGRFLSPIDVEYERPVVVIGSEVRERLFRSTNPIDSNLLIGKRRFKIVGVMKAQGQAFGRSQDNHVMIPIGAFGRIFGGKRDMAIAVSAPAERLSEAEDQVVEVLRRARSLRAEQEDNFSINQQAALVKMFQSETGTLFGVVLAIGVITLIVGGIGVMNIMLVAVTERTREIGIRRAIGARRRTILIQFLVEATLVTVFGGTIGTALGVGGARLFSVMGPLMAIVSVDAIVVGLVTSTLVGLGFGTWPAYRAARLDPIDALRYE